MDSYFSVDEIPEEQQIECLDLRCIAYDCETDTLDLADTKYELVDKYVIECDYAYTEENTTIKHIINIDILNFHFCTSLTGLFYNFTALETIDGLDKINISHLCCMEDMFENCKSLKSIDLSNWYVGGVNDMKNMFKNCVSLTSLNISNWKTYSLQCLNSTFANCTSLQTLDLSEWYTIHVSDMTSTFANCTSLVELNLSNWRICEHYCYKFYMKNMFDRCNSLMVLDLSYCDNHTTSSFRNCIESLNHVEDNSFDELTIIYPVNPNDKEN